MIFQNQTPDLMKSTFALTLMALLTLSVTLIQGQDLTTEKTRITAICDQYAKAWATEDIALFSELFVHSADLVIFDGSSSYKGWDAWKQRLVNSFPDAQDVKVTFRDHNIQVNSAGTAAFLTAAEDVDYVENGKAFSFQGMRITWILVKMEGKWVIIHGHWSVPVRD
jgi:uncharacterized protein (TIGR02246 family)